MRGCLVLLAVAAMTAVSCADQAGDDAYRQAAETPMGTAAAGPGGDAEEAGHCSGGVGRELIWAHDEEPPDLHVDDPANSVVVASWVRQGLWEGLYGVSRAATFIPELLADEATVEPRADGSVRIGFRLREDLTWSDGTPLTAAHVEGTLAVIMEGYDPRTEQGGAYPIGDRSGYDLITAFDVHSDTRFSIQMSRFVPWFKELFGEVFPTHVIGTANATNEALVDFRHEGVPLPSSGPMLFEGWERGSSMSLRRNPLYHGSTSPDVANPGVACVSGVRIEWLEGTDAVIRALQQGEADVVFTQADVAFMDAVSRAPAFTVASAGGSSFEHWGLNLQNPHLRDPAVREALAYALNKYELMERVYIPLFGSAVDARGLGNSYWMTNHPAYEDHQQRYGRGQPERAKERLASAGYVEGDNGIHEHPDRGELWLRVGTTGGDRFRELQQELLAAQMQRAGIGMILDNVPGGLYFVERPFAPEALACAWSGGTDGDCDIWDIAQFGLPSSPWPGERSGSYRSGSADNPYGFSSAAFDEHSRACDEAIEDQVRADCYNELDRYATTLEIDGDQGLFVLPLGQRPWYFAFHDQRVISAAGVPDARAGGPLVYVVDYVAAP